MAWAAYCEGCGGNVYVREDGTCQHGHPPGQLSRYFETENPSASLYTPPEDPGEPGLAVDRPEGARPASLAAPLPAYAPAGHYGTTPPPPAPAVGIGNGVLPPGVPRFSWPAFFFPLFWAIAYEQWLLAGITVAASVGLGLIAVVIPTVSAAANLVGIGVNIWIALIANTEYWKTNPKGLTAEEFRSKQTKWIVVGVALFVLGVLLAAALFAFASALVMQGLVPEL